jgi:transglutaminase-like putative cysteine protease
VSRDTALLYLITDRDASSAHRVVVISRFHLSESRLKRRDFLAATAVLSLLAQTPAHAAKKSTAKAPAKSTSRKSPAKPSPRKTAATTAATETRNVISLPDEPQSRWRTYDIRSSISVNRINGKCRLWLPLAQYKDTLWERSLGHSWQGNFENAGIYRDPVADMEVFFADWPESIATPTLQIISQVATQDRHFDITRRGAVAERTEVLRRCLQATEQVPLDGIVRRTAEQAIGRTKDPLAMGKAIYDWVIENASHDPLRRGSRIDSMLESGQLNANSTRIALLFVGLCRAIGIPARPVFGLRIDSSRLFGSLGVMGNLSEAEHCRAEFYTPGYGWIPVDPSDVRLAMHAERLANGDPKLTVLKKLLFGFWEMNWISFNAAQDVVLRGSSGNSLPYLTRPVVESADGRLDTQDGSRFSYKVTASRADSQGSTD